MHRLRIFFTAAEVAPFAKTGGLADAISALPKALAAHGHDVRVALPLYGCIDRARWGLRLVLPEIAVSFPGRLFTGRVWEGCLPDAGGARVPVYFIECTRFFDRPGLYGEEGQDYPDNALRFAFYCMAALGLLKSINWAPDICHCNDWHAGLIPAFRQTSRAFQHDTFFARTRFVYAVHNLGYLGTFPPAVLPVLGLPQADNHFERLEFFGGISFMKAGMLYSDRVCTVSRRYAREILTREFGCGLEGWMLSRNIEPRGIVNGIDPEEWNPAADPLIAAPYSVADMSGKAACKAALEKTLRWTHEPQTPILAMITRLDAQKGVDIFIEALPALMKMGARVAVLGSGAPFYHDALEQAHKNYPKQMRLRLCFDPKLAHAIEAGADIFLMPSRYEPCGLNQMYSMRYGTPPVVRDTGGLADTVTHTTSEAIGNGTATGFVFSEYTPGALTECVEEALSMYRRPEVWRQIMHNAMRQDFSWSRSAAEYEKMYRELLD